MSTKLSKAQQQAIVFLTTKQREAETFRDTVMQDNPDFNFDRARSVYVGKFSKTTVEKLIELGLVEYTFTKSMIALIPSQDDEQPEPEPPSPCAMQKTHDVNLIISYERGRIGRGTKVHYVRGAVAMCGCNRKHWLPHMTFDTVTCERCLELSQTTRGFVDKFEKKVAPLPTASIGETGHATRLDRRPFTFRKSPKMRDYTISYHGGDLIEHSFNGVIYAYENTKTGQWYQIYFSTENFENKTYITLWVNRQYEACHVLEPKRWYYLLYSRIDKNLNEKIAIDHIPSVKNEMTEAHFMLSMFRDKLIAELARQENDTNVTPQPETVAAIANASVEQDIATALIIGTADFHELINLMEITYKETVMEKPKALPLVGDKVFYNGKQCPIVHVIPNGAGGQVFVGIKTPYKTSKGWSTNIITRPYAEFENVSLQAVA